MMANVYSIVEVISGRKKTVLGEVPYSNAILFAKNAIKLPMY
jgi:hypothetical protein